MDNNNNVFIPDCVVWPVYNLTQCLANEHPLDTSEQITTFATDMTAANIVLGALPSAAVVEVERSSKVWRGQDPSSLAIVDAAVHFANNVAGWVTCANSLVEPIIKIGCENS